MGFWRVGADVLARSRFAVSPLAQTVVSLLVLHRERPVPGREPWLRAHLPAYRGRVTANPVERTLVRAALRPGWLADFMTVPPMESDRTFHDELARIRAAPAELLFDDLATALGGPVPAELLVPDLPGRAADLLEWVWAHTVEPEWGRLRRVFEADIVARTGKLGAGGWAEALNGLRPGLRWLGDGRLRINGYGYPPLDVADDARLLFIPVTGGSWVGWDPPRRYAVVYPCTGLLAEPEGSVLPEALHRLLGPVRAGILIRLAEPKSTTQLVALTGHGLGSVGGHLKVLLEARLVRRRRSGRSMLYYRTPLGDRLVDPGAAGTPEVRDLA
ncbi:transcriptional regulator [Streptosporangium violaceochromogenes]|nr:transcriptional regulator [Streptosporangium violaceochromogenes]